MRRQMFASGLAAAAAIGIMTVLPPQAAGQTPAPSASGSAAGQEAPENWVVPRTPWGDPDLQGNLTNLYETGTPLERPDELAGRRLEDIKGEELAAIRRAQQERATNRRLSAPGVQGGTPEIWLSAYDHEKGSMAWFVVDPPEGKIPPITAEAKSRESTRERRSITRDGAAPSYENRSLYDRCISRGLPNSMMPTLYGNSYQIIQAPGYVAIRYEMIHETRIIPLDGREHLAPNVRPWMGDARGWWEGDTLVVETTNFREDMTPRGANPERLRLIERFTRVSPNKIHWYVTYDDPTTWTRPWTHMVPLTIDDSQAIVEYACHEGNYFMWNSLRGDRTQEYAAKIAAQGSQP